MHENEIGTVIVDCAVHLHQSLGPGLLETVYEVTLARILEKRGLSVQRQISSMGSFESASVSLWLRENLSRQNKAVNRSVASVARSVRSSTSTPHPVISIVIWLTLAVY